MPKAKKYKISTEAERVISYFRDSLIDAGRMEISVDRISRDGLPISFEDIAKGKSGPEIAQTLLARDKAKKTDIDIIICPIPLIKTENSFVGPQHAEPFWIPARISEHGELGPARGALPWIPRNFLEPLPKEDSLVVAELSKVEKISNANENKNIRSWKEYYAFSEKLFKKMTGKSFNKFEVEGYKRKNNAIIIANSSSTPKSLISIYENILSGRRPINSLNSLATLKEPKRKTYSYSSAQIQKSALMHLGQFEAKFSLSFSQRLSLFRFFQTKNFETFSVTGPPGTGKTTFLQSVVASLWVKSAVQGKKPPIIVASSETNRAVTNIIDSFNKADSVGSLLEERWLPDVKSFGSFCCSDYKKDEMSHYQLELRNGQGFSSKLENKIYLKEAEEYLIDKFSEYRKIKKSIVTRIKLSSVTKELQKELKKECAALIKEVKSMCGGGLLNTLFSSPPEINTCFKNLAALDTNRRYKAFLLASHYYEARWIDECKKELSKKSIKKKGRTNFKGEKSDWQRRAMLTPAFVSTISMLPRFFGYRTDDNSPMIDLLIFDEAGQITPESGAACTALARKTLVVGDPLQLEPLSEISSYIDLANLAKNKLIKKENEEEFRKAKRRGLVASQNSLMELALRSAKYLENNSLGGFLSEHRRSVPEMVAFCNQIAYRGRLNAKRPGLKTRVLPAFAYAHVSGKSKKRGPSRENASEAKAIAGWLKDKGPELEKYYKGQKLDQLVAVVTPFTAQAKLLKSYLKKSYPKMMIGTVNSLQGAERAIVVFSAAYDRSFEGQYFFDRSPNFLNVAVSRAKDSFVVFGDMNIFDQNAATPSGLLAKFLFYLESNEILNVEPAEDISGDEVEYERIITLDGHREILRKAFEISREQVLIVSPTISIVAINADKVCELISEAKERGVKVLIYTDRDLDAPDGNIKENADAGRKALIEAGAELRIARQVHNKSLAIDKHTLVDGSFNWLSAVRNRESRYQKWEISSCYRGAGVAEDIRVVEEEMKHRVV